MKISRNFFAQILFVLFVCVYSVLAVSPTGDIFTIGGIGSDSADQGLMGTFDAGGYSDVICYGKTAIHDFYSHELLSGEWGAAIYYDGIDSEWIDPSNPAKGKKAMWLTDYFKYPYWRTNSLFFVPDGQLHQVWNNPANPIQSNDAARSWVCNQSLEVQIDYEIADLETITNPSIRRSPMVFYEPNAVVPSVVYSDRYVLLQTYTFRNTDPNHAITNLEFYQFLHSHGADVYAAAVSSCYASNLLSDGLQYYIPFDPIHSIGNFRYDITQWNDPQRYPEHVDYVGFSSTVEPHWIDNDTYNGHSGRPSEGTHIHIENRQLNNVAGIYNREAGGAMGWNLGTLNPIDIRIFKVNWSILPIFPAGTILKGTCI